MSRAWAKGSTTAWRKLRLAILARDGYRCQIRTDRCTDTADCVHHTLGRAITGDDPRYLAAACTPCNLAIGEPGKQPDPPGRSTTRW